MPAARTDSGGHAFVACRAAYGQWDPQLGRSTGAEDLAHLLLDRTKQRARLLQARDDFFDLPSKPRVQCFLAVGTGGNLIADFPRQAITHLRQHPKPGVQAVLHAVEVQPTDVDTDRLETRFRSWLGLKPSQGLGEGLRPPGTRFSNERLLPVLAWTLVGPGTPEQRLAVTRAILHWSRESLAPACPDDMRILSLMAVEATDTAETETLAEALEDYDEDLTDGQEYRRTAAFRYEALDPLSGVRKRDLRHYFDDSELCTDCPDGLRRAFPGLLLAGHTEMRQ